MLWQGIVQGQVKYAGSKTPGFLIKTLLEILYFVQNTSLVLPSGHSSNSLCYQNALCFFYVLFMFSLEFVGTNGAEKKKCKGMLYKKIESLLLEEAGGWMESGKYLPREKLRLIIVHS